MTNKQKIRERFREEVFIRDKHACRLCGSTNIKLDAHHIWNREEMPNGGYVKENGITLCDTNNGCHFQVEQFYFSVGLENDLNNRLHPNNLFKLINSSYGLAVRKSNQL